MNVSKQITLVVLLLVFVSCGKEFLDIKRNANQVVPTEISAYQAILDRISIMNGSPPILLGFVGADEFFVSSAILNGLSFPHERNAYKWAADVYEGREFFDWNNAYQRILYANMALDVEKIKPSVHEQETWNNVKGSAHFFRAYNYYHLAQIFCKTFDSASSSRDLGLPLRIDYDITVKYKRSSLQEVYDFIISDLEISLKLLPILGSNKYRPSKAQAYMMLAKVYLQMEDYEKAYQYSVDALAIHNELIDFNLIDLGQNYSFANDYAKTNTEVLFFNWLNVAIISEPRVNFDTDLLTLYEDGDLRRNVYFKKATDQRVVFKGSYSSNLGYFTGLATNELWLIKAESAIRTGRIQDSENSLNHLLKHRYKKDSFTPYIFNDPKEALKFILTERRKELFMRGTRWEDLKRLNKEPEFAITLVREIEGVKYDLPANDPRWVWPIPDNEVELNNLEQNPR